MESISISIYEGYGLDNCSDNISSTIKLADGVPQETVSSVPIDENVGSGDAYFRINIQSTCPLEYAVKKPQ